ncbi:CD151 antigen isoform X4 [Nerophis ophidion]|uniref:CD151 antigen isoform X4 n=1 Tax=Nerophis ophidion TaxID=159077 RepID=UPI002ADF56BB|nr:CD151 antigen isoform X4 [Nerophis ophidion]
METIRENNCGTICLKYLLIVFNILFWLAGGALVAVGVWTVVEKSDYISLLDSGFYSKSAYILIAAGVIVFVTGIIGCCATLMENKSLLIVLDDALRQNLEVTLLQKYQQPGEDGVTRTVDKLHQEFQCCGSNSSSDWRYSTWIQAAQDEELVPVSCCKTPSSLCGRRDHPSNIYKGGCIGKLEDFLLYQLYILSGLGIGIAILQLLGMMFTCCLYQKLEDEPH